MPLTSKVAGFACLVYSPVDGCKIPDADMDDHPPDEYRRFVLEDVRLADENLTLVYAGHIFGGVVRCLLDPNGVEDALRPGAEIFVRYHTPETGQPGQVAHIIIRHPSAGGWAEIYADGV